MAGALSTGAPASNRHLTSPVPASSAYRFRSAEGTNTVRPAASTAGPRWTGPTRARHSTEARLFPARNATTSPPVDAATTVPLRTALPFPMLPAAAIPPCTDPASLIRHRGCGPLTPPAFARAKSTIPDCCPPWPSPTSRMSAVGDRACVPSAATVTRLICSTGRPSPADACSAQ